MQFFAGPPSQTLARYVSIVAHPFVMIAVAVGATSAARGALSNVMTNVAVVSVFLSLPIAVVMITQVRRGGWNNVDASRPQERPLLYRVGIAGAAGLIFFLAVTRPESELLRATIVALVLLSFCALATRWIKLSLHAAAGALTATTLLIVGSSIGWIIALALPLLCWSRLALGRHTLGEVAAGLGCGVLAGIAIHFP